MKNTLNTIKETAKKQTKHIALASALIATLGSCGNKTENSETTSTDSIKTEQVEKVDTLTNQDSININDLENIEGDADEILAEFENENPSQETKQTPQEAVGVSKEEQEAIESVYNDLDKELTNMLNLEEYIREDKASLQSIGKMIEMYTDAAKALNKPISPKAQKVIDKYKSKK